MISRIASQDALGTSSTGTVSATYPATTTAGNLLIASVWSNATTDTAAITGWTKRQSQHVAATVITHSVFDKIADGTETTISSTGAGTAARIHIYEYTGNANPIVVDASNINNNVVTHQVGASPSIATANANDLIFASLATSAAVTAVTVDAPFNLRQVDVTIRLMDADQIVAATGTYAATFRWTNAVTTSAITVAYQASAGGFFPFM